MYSRILVPLDGSSLAERALDHVRWLAPAETTDIVLLSVVEPWQYYFGSGDYSPPDLVNTIRRYAQEYLEGRHAQLRSEGYNVSIQIREGDPAETILEVAQENSVDLIAMSTHGRSGFIRWTLGSVAERVLQGATVPILLVREHTPIPAGRAGRILVPLDGSELAELALAQAQEIATNHAASLLLLQVLDTRDGEALSSFFESKEEVAELMIQWQSEAETYLDEVAQRLLAGGVNVATRIVSGDPHKEIAEIATQEGIDLIVMSTHGRSGLSRWFYGSTASKVLRAAPCPLLLVRAARPAASRLVA